MNKHHNQDHAAMKRYAAGVLAEEQKIRSSPGYQEMLARERAEYEAGWAAREAAKEGK